MDIIMIINTQLGFAYSAIQTKMKIKLVEPINR